MTEIIRTNTEHQHFIKLVEQLDAELAERDGTDHSFYAQFNKIDKIKHVVVIYESGVPVGCGAIKEFNSNTVEVKRMYTVPGYRGKGIGSRILNELELWAFELGYEQCVLETGKKQPEAIALYRKNGYNVIENYGQYAAVDNSVCFQKQIIISTEQDSLTSLIKKS